MSAKDFFNNAQKAAIVDAIKQAELNTSGEVMLHIDKKCTIDVLDRAVAVFEQLEMHKTKLRNGVLFYISTSDHKFAILGDAGINAVTPDDFWDIIKNTVLDSFKKNEYTEGLCKGILMAGEALKSHFPYQSDDINELSDEISFGK